MNFRGHPLLSLGLIPVLANRCSSPPSSVLLPGDSIVVVSTVSVEDCSPSVPLSGVGSVEGVPAVLETEVSVSVTISMPAVVCSSSGTVVVVISVVVVLGWLVVVLVLLVVDGSSSQW